jgi:hypothetical protein
LRFALMLIVALPYFCIFLVVSHRFIEGLVLKYLPRAVD